MPNETVHPSPAIGDQSSRGLSRPERIRWLSLDTIAIVLIFLQTTELYRPIGFLLRLPSSQVINIAFLIILGTYCLIRLPRLRRVGARGLPFAWLAVLLLFPSMMLGLQWLAGAMAAERVFYWISFSSLYAVIMISATVLWQRYGPRLTMPFFIAAICATWFGFIVSQINYGFVRQVLDFTSNEIAASESFSRLMGFYPNPNAAAFALCIFLTCLVTDQRFLDSNYFIQILLSVVVVIGVVLTGSRTSMLLLLIVIGFWCLNLATRRRVGSFGRVLRFLALPVLLLALTALVAYLLQALASVDTDLISGMIARLTSIGSVFDGSIVDSDVSVGFRVQAVDLYLSDIARSPLLGYGPGFAAAQQDMGNYAHVSQVSWLDWSIKYGVPYALFVAAVMIGTVVVGVQRGRISPLVRTMSWQTMLLIALATFSLIDIFWLRSATVTVGVLAGLMIRIPLEDERAKLHRRRSMRRMASTPQVSPDSGRAAGATPSR